MPLLTHLPVRASPFDPPSANNFPFGEPIRNSVRDAFVDHVMVVSPSPEPSLKMGFGSAERIVPATTFAGIAFAGGSGGGFEQAAASTITARPSDLAGQLLAIPRIV